jgi:hypothetical protein
VGAYWWFAGIPVYGKTILFSAALGALGWAVTKFPTMLESFYLRKLLRLDAARKQLEEEHRKSFHKKYGSSIINVDNEFFYDLTIEKIAKRAGVWSWIARSAEQWEKRRKRKLAI